MTILGNGVDIVDNSRIKRSIKNINFIKRIYSLHEISASKKIKNKANFFAKRFAAKEAFVKSLGTGFRNGIKFNDISIKNNKIGKPKIYLNNKLKSLILKKFKIKKFKINLSLTDENKHSVAFVIINKI
jgi:holo-[acyl-carrier protein] synthase